MKDNTFSKVFNGNFLNHWSRVSQCKKPVIAAVNGYAVSLIKVWLVLKIFRK